MEEIIECKVVDAEWAKKIGKTTHLDRRQFDRLFRLGKVIKVDENIKPDQVYQTKVLTAEENNYLVKSSFSNKKKVKIAWVQDYSKENGGAELSNRYLVQVGEKLGFDIVAITPSHFYLDALNKADIVVINNIFEFAPDKFREIQWALFEKRKPYIKYDHDFRELQRINFSTQLFSQSVFNVFISPFHLEAFKKINNNNKNLILPLAIDTALYNVKGGAVREKNSVLVPSIKKCGNNIFDYISKNKEQQYGIIGQFDNGVDGAQIRCITLQNPKEMVNIYNQYETVLHLPLDRWAGERIIFEGMLCGCKVVGNGNIGHLSWNFTDENLKSELDKAPITFWKEVLNAVS